jgi:hypothetical protein
VYPALKQNLGSHQFKDDGMVETVVTLPDSKGDS